MRAADLPETFTRRQAIESGLTDGRLRRLRLSGVIEPVRHGVFERADRSGAGVVTRHLAEARAAMDRFTTGYAVSHLSAAAAHGLPVPLGEPGPVHLTAVHATQRSRQSPGVVVHHADSSPTPVTEASGLVVTTVARTLADCLRTRGPRVSVPLADAALHRGLLTIDELEGELAMQRRWRGRPRALVSLMLVDGRRESWLESYGCVRLSEWGLALPEPQVNVYDAAGEFVARVDGAYREDATVLEFDGRAKYALEGDRGHEAAFFREKQRHNELVNTGAAVVRIELADLLERASAIQRAVLAARSRGNGTAFRGSFVSTPATGLRKSCVSDSGRPRHARHP